MKKITGRITAAIAAAVMTVSAVTAVPTSWLTSFAETGSADSVTDASLMPYAELSERDIEKVTVSEYDCGAEDARQTELTGSDALKIVKCLKQIVIGESAEEAYSGLVGMSAMEVSVKYEDGSEKTVDFRNNNMLFYNGTVVWCNKEPYREIEDILYHALNDLPEDDIRYEKRSGWFKLDGVKRRYNKGLPYTGWLKNKDGSRKYCLDGYLMTGEFQIGKYIYSFGEDGIYTGEKTLSPLTGSCGKISTDAGESEIKVTLNDKSGKKYGVASPYTIERWQNGSWVNWTDEETLKEYSDVILSKDKKTGSVYFYPGWFTLHAFSAGYYRVTLPVWEDGKISIAPQKLYVVFEAVPPVQVKTPQDVYKIDKGDDVSGIDVWASITINSEKIDKNEIAKITGRIDKDLGGIRETVVSEVPYIEECDSVDSYGNISFCIDCPPEPGNYVLIVTVGYSKYYWTFRIESN